RQYNRSRLPLAAVPTGGASFRLLTLSCRYGMLFGSDCNDDMLRDVTGVKRGDTVGLTPLVIMLLDLLENLVQWRFLSSGGWVPRLNLAWACVTAHRAVLMGGSPDLPHIHIPGAITELADLSDIHPVPTIPHGDFRSEV